MASTELHLRRLIQEAAGATEGTQPGSSELRELSSESLTVTEGPEVGERRLCDHRQTFQSLHHRRGLCPRTAGGLCRDGHRNLIQNKEIQKRKNSGPRRSRCASLPCIGAL